VDSSRLTGWVAGKTGACGSRFPVLASFSVPTQAQINKRGHVKNTRTGVVVWGPLKRCLLKGVLEATPDIRIFSKTEKNKNKIVARQL
jgi:hypothetical protein